MAHYELHGIKLRVPDKTMDGELRKSLENGDYEWNERMAVTRHVTRDDVVLDIGAGVGFISALAAQVAGPARVISVEANPALQRALRANLDGNGARGSVLLHGAVVPDSHEGDSVSFALTSAFWASALKGHELGSAEVVTVPALRLSDLLDRYAPTVVIMDVEGAEAAFCEQPWPDAVRILILEIHTQKYPPRTVKRIFDGFSAQGFTIMPWGTRGEVITLQRVYGDDGRALCQGRPSGV